MSAKLPENFYVATNPTLTSPPGKWDEELRSPTLPTINTFLQGVEGELKKNRAFGGQKVTGFPQPGYGNTPLVTLDFFVTQMRRVMTQPLFNKMDKGQKEDYTNYVRQLGDRVKENNVGEAKKLCGTILRFVTDLQKQK